MKLFGNSHKSARKTKKEKPQKDGFWHSIGRGKRALLIILTVLLVLVTAVIGLELFFVKAPTATAPHLVINTTDPDTGEKVTISGSENAKDGYYTILLAGTDHDGTRTDTIMIARLDTYKHSLAFMSIPRDTLVEYGGRKQKINSVFGAYGCGKKGMEALMLEVEDIVGFMPTGYILVDLNAFVELVDTIGGVQFNVPQRMYYTDPTQDLYIDLYPGQQLLDGQHAMQLVRFRSYAAADIQRTKVQQEFLKEVAKQSFAVENLTKISDYCQIIARNVTTNFTAGNLVYFAQELAKCDFNNIAGYTLPGESVMIASCGSSYRLYQNQVDEIVQKDFTPPADGQ